MGDPTFYNMGDDGFCDLAVCSRTVTGVDDGRERICSRPATIWWRVGRRVISRCRTHMLVSSIAIGGGPKRVEYEEAVVSRIMES